MSRLASLACRLLVAATVSCTAVFASPRPIPAAPAVAQPVLTLAYHDVVDLLASDSESDTVTVRAFGQHLQWLKRQGYTFVSADQVIDSRSGERLPPKPVLLTFDDGYRSFYTHVFPLLLQMKVPSVLAVVGSWHVPDQAGNVLVAGKRVPASKFLSEEQLQELADSGLVELASHSYALHEEVLANPQGGRIPSAITRRYDAGLGRRESFEQYEARLRADLRQNMAFIAKFTHRPPRILAWPFGRYNGPALRAASDVGHELVLTLTEGRTPDWSTGTLGRKYIQSDLNLADFAEYVLRPDRDSQSYRHLAVKLDALLAGGAAVAETELRLSALMDEIGRTGANAVLVSPHTQDCRSLFVSPSRPLGQDLLSRTVWQLHTRLQVDVLLDVDVRQCPWNEATAEEMHAAVNAAPFDGLVIRGSLQLMKQAEALAAAFSFEEPLKPIASNLPLTRRTLALRVIDACGLGEAVTGAFEVPAKTWTEIDASECEATRHLESLARSGALAFGVNRGFRPDAARLSKADMLLLHGLLLRPR